MEAETRGVRRGAWTYVEDKLLKGCIDKYGAGKWHLVPERAGLNRCRKSCRLRWLNYLDPKIKRGSFAEDEVDMILRLHKLLGNRWSLIAGRLPGRTANDVKNYWHTHLRKKVASNKEEKLEKPFLLVQEEKDEKPKEAETILIRAHEVIKPRPRTFSNHSPWLKGKQEKHGVAGDIISDGGVIRECCALTPLVASNEDHGNAPREGGGGGGVGDIAPQSAMWLESLLSLDDQLSNEKIDICSLLSEQEENSILEFPNVEDLFTHEGPSTGSDWDNSNLCDFDSLWDF